MGQKKFTVDTLNKITTDLAGKVVEFIKNCVEGPRGYRIGQTNIQARFLTLTYNRSPALGSPALICHTKLTMAAALALVE